MFLETDLDNRESFGLSPHSSTPEVAIKIGKPSFVVKLLKKLGKKFHAH